MSDGLVRKSDVQKIINAYFAEWICGSESFEECLRVLEHSLELNILIDNMKEVTKGDS